MRRFLYLNFLYARFIKSELKERFNCFKNSTLFAFSEWSSKQNLMEKRIFTSWSLMIPKDFSEDWDENKLQLISPDDRRCITISAVTLDRNIPAEMALPPVEEFMRMGGKLHSKIKKGKLRGYIIEKMMHDVFIIQCSIAGPSRLLMLTFTISNTKEDKDWAFQVSDSVKLYQS